MRERLGDYIKCIKEGQQAVRTILHPNKYTGKKMTVSETLSFYYKVGGMSFVLAAVVELAVYWFGGGATKISGVLGLYTRLFGFGLPEPFANIVMTAIVLLVIAPLSFFINSAIYQFVCKDIFGIWKGNYSRTFTASVFSYLPIALLFWGLMLPYVHPLFMVAAVIWSLIVLLISLSNQQNISVLKAAGAVLLTALSVMVVIMMLGFAIGLALRHLVPAII